MVVFCVLAAPCAWAAGKARHVIVIVWDGMRPEFVTEELSPTLCGLARSGVTFRNHHSQFPSTTQVNGAALATGSYPGHSGLVGNVEFRPQIDAQKPVETGVLATVRKGDEVTGGHYLLRPTMAETVRRAGRHTLTSGAKTALLLDRAERADASGGINLVAGQTFPPTVLNRITQLLGAFPPTGVTKIDRDNWTASAFIRLLGEGEFPDFSMLWLSEPDFSQHEIGPGSATARACVSNSDRNLARVLSALDAKGVRDSTDILVVSDHGVSTVSQPVDVARVLKQAGFHATREWDPVPAQGDILVAGDGGAVFFYIAGRDSNTIRRLVTFLQGTDFTGVIFSRQKHPGTFSLKQARIDSPQPPDVAVSMRWADDLNDAGLAGTEFCDLSEPTPSLGEHGTLSRHDLHNILFAAGPDFRPGSLSDLPSGNTDIAPTVLWILGLKSSQPMDGRVLTEGLTIAGPKVGKPRTKRLKATRDLGASIWSQYLEVSELNGVTYFNEGNSEQKR